ncbi:venom metalloproteinase 3-like [Trichogramma pretiosum]|uniref:venom metalloproteinase 3-like n=1 Tax=Trichogramma pretiosum TaxID=7493 RepID=UPI000C71BBAE|nr:venom metalloproteinase 3-like [Trichogramma pretiosum]
MLFNYFLFLTNISLLLHNALAWITEEEYIGRETFDYDIYLQEPEEDRVLLGSNSKLYLAESDQYGSIKYKILSYPVPSPKSQSTTHQKSQTKIKSTLGSDTLYPQILAVLDYENYIAYDKNIEKIAHSMAGFWNVVDLRYRTWKDPHIRLHLAGVVIPTNPNAVPYLTNTIGDKVSDPKPLEAMKQAGIYFFENLNSTQEIPRNSYDIVMLLTNRFLKEGAGLGGIGGACFGKWSTAIMTHRPKRENDYWIAAGAAHELGHLFGAQHDGEETAKSCHANAGHVMSGNRGRNAFTWSECSIRDMRTFFKSDRAQCLKNKPNIGTPYPRILPGLFTTRDQQCKDQNRFGAPSLFADVTVDNQLKQCYTQPCSIIYNGQKRNVDFPLPPLDGTSCGEDKICFAGDCVANEE